MLGLQPITLRAARAFVALHHRHAGPPRGHLCSVSIVDGAGVLRGVGILSRPVSRVLQDGFTAEIARVCTDGVPNGCSRLYGALCRAAAALGYRRVVTYTRADEPGVSLRAAGFTAVARRRAEQWDTPARRRAQSSWPISDRIRWERTL